MIATNYRMGTSTLAEAIKPVCDAIWEEVGLKHSMPQPSKEYWLYQAEGFKEKWNFPNCLGAVDGKHVRIQAPANSASLFFNYKKYFSIVLMAVAGFDYRFTYIDVGSYGHQNDSQIFEACSFSQMMREGSLQLPEDAPLPMEEGPKLPFFFLGDNAFPLAMNLMKAYPREGSCEMIKIFNYRICRARRVVENAFGILASRWRIYHRSMNLTPDKADSVIKATVALHNLLTTKDDEITAAYLSREETDEEPDELVGLAASNSRNPPANEKDVRDRLKVYFSTTGQVSWQRERAYLDVFAQSQA